MHGRTTGSYFKASFVFTFVDVLVVDAVWDLDIGEWEGKGSRLGCFLRELGCAHLHTRATEPTIPVPGGLVTINLFFLLTQQQVRGLATW